MLKFLNSIKDYIIIILVVVLFRTFIATPAVVNGDSMDNTLKDGHIVLINKLSYVFGDVKRFDIVVLNNESDSDKIIKRVIGLPNEKIEYKNNKLYINDKEVKFKINFESTEDFIVETKENEYFVLGDNRDVSKDSRVLGNFNKEDIVGKVGIRFYPVDKFGSIE